MSDGGRPRWLRWWGGAIFSAMCAGAAFIAQVTPETGLPPWATWSITLGGTAATMLAVLLVARQTWAEIRARDDAKQLATKEVANYRLALESILLPLTDIFDRIVTAPNEAGRREAKGAMKQAVVNSAVQFANVSGARSCYFDYERNGRLICRTYAGRGARPRTEFFSTDRDHAEIFQLLESRQSKLIENVDTGNPPSFPFDGNYKTCISVPVATSAEIFGLLTLDTLHAGELSPRDETEILLLAQLLGIALASDGSGRGGIKNIIVAGGWRVARLGYSLKNRGNHAT